MPAAKMPPIQMPWLPSKSVMPSHQTKAPRNPSSATVLRLLFM